MAIPTQTDIGYPVRVHWAADTGPMRSLINVNKFVVHDTEGNMPYDEQVLTAADNNIASCHALILKTGELVFMVPLELTAWTPGNDVVAQQSINVEMSGFASSAYTDEQYKSMAAFFRWCVKQGCAIPAEYAARTGRAGILGHQDVPNPNTPGAFGGASGHTDPGPLFSWTKFISLIKEGAGVPNIPPGMIALDNPNNLDIYNDAFKDPVTGFQVIQPFSVYYRDNGGLAVFGHPTSGLYGATPGGQDQTFEFGRLWLDKASGKVMAELKDHNNPKGFAVGGGVMAALKAEGLTAISNEDYYTPNKGVGSGLTQRSFTYAQDAKGVTFRVEAIQDQGPDNKPLPTWSTQLWQFVKEVK